MSNFQLNVTTSPMQLTGPGLGSQGPEGPRGLRGSSAGTPEVAAFMRKLHYGGQAACVTILGDSTGDAVDEWAYRTFNSLSQSFPAYTFLYRTWNIAGECYDPPTVVRLGTAGERFARGTGVTSPAALADRSFTAPGIAANTTTGDLDVRVRVKLNTQPVIAGSLCAKYNAAGSRSWRFEITAAGNLYLGWSADGTNEIAVATTGGVLTGSVVNQATWLRATLDVDNGSGSRVIKFWWSIDNATWTQLGTTATTAGTTSVFDSTVGSANASYTFNGRGGAIAHAADWYAMQVYDTIDGTRPVVDLDMAQFAGTVGGSTFPDWAGNVWTVSGEAGVLFGAKALAVFNGSASGSRASYYDPAVQAVRFGRVNRAYSDLVIVSYGYNELGLTDYRPQYKSLCDGLSDRWSDVGLVCILQGHKKSPATAIPEHALRLEQVHKYAASSRHGVIDVHTAFGGNDAYVSSDGIHPTSAGQDVWFATVLDYFTDWML